MIRLLVGDHEVTAVAGPHGFEEGYADSPDSVWRATLAAARGVLASYAVNAVEVTTTSGLIALWDVETLGSPCPLLTLEELGNLPDSEPHTWALVEAGRYAVGTLESYVIARLTRGTWHVSAAEPGRQPLPAPQGALADLVIPGAPFARTEPSVFLGLDVAIRLSPLSP